MDVCVLEVHMTGIAQCGLINDVESVESLACILPNM